MIILLYLLHSFPTENNWTTIWLEKTQSAHKAILKIM